MPILENGESKNSGADFAIEQVQLQFPVKFPIKKLIVKSNLLCIVLITGGVYKIDLNNPEDVITIQLPLKSGNTVESVFIDNSGDHMIIKSSRLEYYYINKMDSKWKHLSKLKGSHVSSLTFVDKYVTEFSTGPIFITMNDRLVQYHIDNHNESSVKQVHDFKSSVTMISVDTTASELIINLLADFKLLQLSKELPQTGAHFNFNTKLDFKFILRDPSITKVTCNSNSFAYVSNIGVSFAKSDISSQKQLSTIRIDKFIASILVAKYHIFVLTEDNILLVYEQLSHQLVQTHHLDQFGEKFIGFESDEQIGTYWAYSKSKIFEIVTDNESEGIWMLLLDMNRFDESLAILDPQRDFNKSQIVLSKKAAYLFSKEKYLDAAMIYGITNDPFEDVALKLMDLNDKSILRNYLLIKLDNLPKHYSGQSIILSTWILELFVEELNAFDKELVFKSNDESNLKKLESLTNEFHKFYTTHSKTLDKDTVYEILKSHNRVNDLLNYANEIKDYQFVLKNCIQCQKWGDALKVLLTHGDPDLVYQSCTVLMINEPSRTIDMLIRLQDEIDPLKIIPSILIYNKNIAFVQGIGSEFNQALRYLKFLIYDLKVNNVNIHNTFLTILITYPNQINENHILKHLENLNDVIKVDYDFILRLCFKFRRIQSAIKIYSILEKYENGITLALDNDLLSIGLRVADKPLGLHRKKLWLLISNKLINNLILNDNFIEENQSIFKDFNKVEENPMSYLIKFLILKCDSLTINDLLPLVPDFVIIDDFKDDIVNELTNTADKISKMSLEMDQSLREADNNKQKIKNFKNDSFQIIEPYDSCLICHQLLSLKKFYVFPCFHSFHQDCLVQEILNSNDYKLKNRIFKLQKSIKLNSGNSKIINETKKEIDDIISTNCCLCTDISINQIDEPLVKPNVSNEWDI